MVVVCWTHWLPSPFKYCMLNTYVPPVVVTTEHAKLPAVYFPNPNPTTPSLRYWQIWRTVQWCRCREARYSLEWLDHSQIAADEGLHWQNFPHLTHCLLCPTIFYSEVLYYNNYHWPLAKLWRQFGYSAKCLTPIYYHGLELTFKSKHMLSEICYFIIQVWL